MSKYLFVLPHKPSEGMSAWFWKVVSQECGIQTTDCEVIYMLDSVPKGASGRATKEQIRASWDRFSKEIEESEARVVIPLGSQPLYFLTGIQKSIFDARGYVITNKFFRPIEYDSWEQFGEYKTGNKKLGRIKGDPRYKWITKSSEGLLGSDFQGIVIPTFTLEYIRTSAFSCKPSLKEDILRAKRASKGTLKLVDENLVYYTDFSHVETEDGTRTSVSLNLKQIPWSKDLIALDIETHGIDNDVIDRVSISDGHITASLAWSNEVRSLLNDILTLSEPKFVFHNSPFDVPRLIQHGVNITTRILENQIFDTMFGAVILQPDLHKGLGRCASVYLDCQLWKDQNESNPIFYSAKDAFITAWLARQEIKVMKTLGTYDLFTKKIMPAIPVLTEMTQKGIRTNRPYAEKWTKKLVRRQLKYEQLWAKKFPNTDPHSSQSVQKLLYGEWGLPIQRTREGGISVDELSLVKLKYYINAPPEELVKVVSSRTLDLLLKLRDVSKMLSTYVQPVAESESIWVHPSYLPISKDAEAGKSNKMTSKGNTSTGRLATYNPNIGNQPKKARVLYVPDNEDMCFLEADWKSAESYVMAYSANDKRLLDDLKIGIHEQNAERFGIDRDTAKNVYYAQQYLAGPSKVNEMILEQTHKYVPVEECKRIMYGLQEYYYQTTAFKRHLVQLCETQKYIKNPFGRIRFFHDGRTPAAVDFWPQSIVADCLWEIIPEVARMAKSLGGRFTTTVYDSVLIQVPRQVIQETAERLMGIMQRRFEIVAPLFSIPCELKFGQPGASWGELSVDRLFE